MRRATSFSSSSTDGSDTKTGPDSWCCHLAFADMHIYMFPESFGIGMDRNEGLASYGPAAHVWGLACIMFGALTGAYLAPAAGLPAADGLSHGWIRSMLPLFRASGRSFAPLLPSTPAPGLLRQRSLRLSAVAAALAQPQCHVLVLSCRSRSRGRRRQALAWLLSLASASAAGIACSPGTKRVGVVAGWSSRGVRSVPIVCAPSRLARNLCGEALSVWPLSVHRAAPCLCTGQLHSAGASVVAPPLW